MLGVRMFALISLRLKLECRHFLQPPKDTPEFRRKGNDSAHTQQHRLLESTTKQHYIQLKLSRFQAGVQLCRVILFHLRLKFASFIGMSDNHGFRL